MNVLRILAIATLMVLMGCGQGKDAPVEPVDRPERTDLRAYHGAPPVIPHDLYESGRTNCLSCHGPGQHKGGQAVAAETPHPEWDQCQQCHVARTTEELFTDNTLVALDEPVPVAMPSPFLPPYIPHRLDNFREEACETCHIGPAARLDLRPKHGPRTNCRQCHLPTESPLEGFGSNIEPFKPLPME